MDTYQYTSPITDTSSEQSNHISINTRSWNYFPRHKLIAIENLIALTTTVIAFTTLDLYYLNLSDYVSRNVFDNSENS